MKIKTIMRYHSHSLKYLKLKRPTMACAGETVGHWLTVRCAPLENQPAISYEVSHRPHCAPQFHAWDPSKINESILSQDVCKNVHSPFFQLPKPNYRAQVSINRRTEKENTVVYSYTDSYLEIKSWFTTDSRNVHQSHKHVLYGLFCIKLENWGIIHRI